MATFGTLFFTENSLMDITSPDSRLARWRIFPNVLDFIFMAVWVFLSQFIVLSIAVACGIEIPGPETLPGADAELSLAAEPDTARTLMIIYAPSMLLSIAGVVVYRFIRGGRGRLVRFSVAGLNPTLLLWGVIWMFATEVVIEPLLVLLPPLPDMVGRGFFALLVTVVVAPVCEEVLCRGIVLESLRGKYGPVAAWIFSSLFFAAIHGHVTSMVNALIIGSIIGYICLRSKSIFSAIILHAINNALALMTISFGFGNTPLSSFIPDGRIYAAVYGVSAFVCAVGLISLVSGLVAEHRAAKESKSEASEQ